MKILHLCDSLNPAGLGGYESYLHYLSEHLVGRGDVSVVVTQASRLDSPEHIDFEFYSIHFLTGNHLEARKWELFALPEENREQHASVMFKKNDLELNIAALETQLSDFICEFKPDIIHAHSTYVVFNRVLAGLQEKGVLDKIPLIAMIHGRPKPLILPSGERTTDIESFSDVCPFDLVLAVSQNVATVLDEHFSRKGVTVPVLPLYLGIDLSVFYPIPELEKKWDIAFLGRLEKMKAVDLFPEMLGVLKQDYPHLKMVMTGEGSLKEKLLTDFVSVDVSHMVDYLGVIETDDVPKLINQSRIFIYPSREEPFGLSILEAMACEVPVVTTNVYGPLEINTDGVDGLTINPDNVDELVAAVRTLLENKELRTQIGKEGRRTVERRFDIKKHLESLSNIYQDLVVS
ncbi:glycosyltransferase family 1 protein [Candidatus Thorarchaeota archaeon]|nr:MAG: glycosyltransferase family 1 protein [Candidatus Thorarchaeota archaeon]